MKFDRFHRPDGSEIEVSAFRVYMIRPPLHSERADGRCKAVLLISALAQQISETVEEARVLLESCDG